MVAGLNKASKEDSFCDDLLEAKQLSTRAVMVRGAGRRIRPGATASAAAPGLPPCCCRHTVLLPHSWGDALLSREDW